MTKRAIIAGASGLIGSSLLDLLLSQPGYDEVLVLVRREFPVNHPKLRKLVIDFSKLSEYAASIKGDAIFCCIGTTRKKTPDVNEYRKIDHDYALQLAEISKMNKISQYHFVSSIGADASSSVFYTRLKGETENDIIKTGLPGIHIYRPSFLTGDRSEHRPEEKFVSLLIKIINPLLFGSLKKYKSIAASTVARVMYKQSLKNIDGVHIYASDKIQQLS